MSQFPEDYGVVLSKYFVLPAAEVPLGDLERGDEVDPMEELFCVADYPVIGLAENDQSKELRLVVLGSSPAAMDGIGDKLVEIE